MNKKEINELRAQYTLDACGISKVVGCYVDENREKVTKLDATFLNLPEEEQHKYFDILKKTLSGAQGKNLFDICFSEEAYESNGTREFLMKLRDSELKDETLLDSFYDRVIENYNHLGQYFILLVEQTYDVPSITEDNLKLEDASDEIYKYILCAVCPVKLSKAGLGYDSIKNEIRDLERNHMVDMPDVGFVFPAFNGRSEDRDNVWLYSKAANSIPEEFIVNVLDCLIPMPAGTQKAGFNELIEDTLGAECDYETVKSIHENLNEIIDEQKLMAISEPVVLDRATMRNVFEKSGVAKEKLDKFDDSFDTHFVKRELRANNKKLENSIMDGDEEMADKACGYVENPYSNRFEEPKIMVGNIMPPKKMELKTPDVVVKINSERTDLVETRIIDGKQYLVIRVDDGLEVNGIPVM